MKNFEILRSFLAATLVSSLFLTSAALWAQVNGEDSEDESPSLDLFDEDAEYTKHGWAQFHVAAGITYLDGDGIFSARLPDGKEIPILNFDRAGLKESDSSYWLSINWRSANSRWGAWFASWRYDVTGSREWQDSLPIGKLEIPVGASVTSEFDATWYILEATYSFYRSESIDTGIGIGLHTVDLDTTIAARIELGDQEFVEESKGLDTLAPLPNILVYLHWKPAQRLNMVGRLGYFGLDYNKYSGQMTNAHIMASYKLSPRWALGLGYQYVDLDLDIEKKDYTQVYDIQFSGPLAFVKFNF